MSDRFEPLAEALKRSMKTVSTETLSSLLADISRELSSRQPKPSITLLKEWVDNDRRTRRVKYIFHRRFRSTPKAKGWLCVLVVINGDDSEKFSETVYGQGENYKIKKEAKRLVADKAIGGLLYSLPERKTTPPRASEACSDDELPATLSQGFEQEILTKELVPKVSLDAPLPSAREDQPSETYDLDREDEDGNPIPVPKLTPEEDDEGVSDGEDSLNEVDREEIAERLATLRQRNASRRQRQADRVQRPTALVKRLSDETQVRSAAPEFPNLQSVILSLLDRNIGIGYASISAGLDEVYSDSPDQDTLQEILDQLEHTDGYIYSEEDLDEDCEVEGCSYILTSDGKERLHKQITAMFASRVDLGPFNNLGEKCIKSINAHLEHTVSTSLKDFPKQTYRVYRQLFKTHRRSTMW